MSCPDLLGSLADETRGETEQVADGEPSDGAGCSSSKVVGNHAPKEESGRRAISCPLTGLGMCAHDTIT